MRISDWISDVCSSDLEIVTSFSLIEGVIGGIYGMLRHQTIEQGIESLQALSMNAKRVQAVRNEIAANSLLSVDQTHDDLMKQRSEESSVGKEGVSTCRSRWWAFH